MHFYAADVYQGAATSVTAFLAVVPKIAGFVALILLLNTMYWPIPPYMSNLILIFAAVTMVFGNTLGLMQTNIKRMLAYSSIAHSGYMLVGLVCVTGMPQATSLGNGVAAVLFYLVSYGLANVAVFGVLSCIKVNGEEAQTLDDIAGFARSHRRLGAVMAIGIFSLIGLPPLALFFGKVFIFGSALEMGYIWIVVFAVINTVISAGYYLRILSAAYSSNPNPATQLAVRRTRQTSAVIAAAGCILLGVAGNPVAEMAKRASGVDRFRKSTTQNLQIPTSRPTISMPEDLDYTVEQPRAVAKPKPRPAAKPKDEKPVAEQPAAEQPEAEPVQ
jgi:NADH-quinone oxidoreductase subunit N